MAMGGADDDIITCGDDNDLVAGDSVSMTFDATDDLVQNIKSLHESIGGSDMIVLGNGNNVSIGGSESDTITSGTGECRVSFFWKKKTAIICRRYPIIGGRYASILDRPRSEWNSCD